MTATALAIARPSIKNKAGVVTDPRRWATSAGYEFWFNAGNADLITALGSTNDGLDGYGWTATTLSVTEGSGGDFLSAADLDPTRIVFDASADALASPRIFGSYDHALQAARFLGYMPTKLSLECYLKWNVVSAGEGGSFFGLTDPASTNTATNSIGCVSSAITNFYLDGNGGAFDEGSVVDINWHKWRITAGLSTTEWFIDEVSQGTFSTRPDILPCAVKFITSTTNRFDLAWLRVFYS